MEGIMPSAATEPRDLVLHVAATLTKEKGQVTIDDLEKGLSGKVSSDEIYRWMETLAKEGIVEVLDWGRWRTARS